jgi:hypothetical protein
MSKPRCKVGPHNGGVALPVPSGESGHAHSWHEADAGDHVCDRHLYHSFPRPRADEFEDATLERGLSILAFMKEAGLVLAPEVINWDVSVIGGGAEQLRILQRRACFTELSAAELAAHCAIFGPIALSFDIARLRGSGATPVIYVRQDGGENALSAISTFCVHGAYHIQHVLRRLQGLKELSDPALEARRVGTPVAPNYELTLQNTNPAGKVVAEYNVPASNVRHVLQHVGFSTIPFDHSIGVLNVFLNMFHPADDIHTGEPPRYYRQREWRLIAGDTNYDDWPSGRSLSDPEMARLQEIDSQFWSCELMVDGVSRRRSALALVYDPVPNWNFFELVEAIFVPERALEPARAIVGHKVAVHPLPWHRANKLIR